MGKLEELIDRHEELASAVRNITKACNHMIDAEVALDIGDTSELEKSVASLRFKLAEVQAEIRIKTRALRNDIFAQREKQAKGILKDYESAK